MGRFVFITGGARSGKSRLAVTLAKEAGGKVAFVATCIPQDREMRDRVSKHKLSRPRTWKTIEEDGKISPVLTRSKDRYDALIIDCLGLLTSNLMAKGISDSGIEKEMISIAKALSSRGNTSILVSNEVGSSIVPNNPAARRFQDLLGLANQIMARYADRVYMMQAGIPIKIKGAR